MKVVMKKMLFPLVTIIALTATTFAGPYSLPVATPAESPCIWTWFAGGSAGYASGDWDEDIYTAHIGAELKCNDYSHAFFLEVGYTEKDNLADITKPGGTFHFRMDTEIIPITLNYKFEAPISGKWSWYAGAGAGIALIDVDGVNTGDADTDPGPGSGSGPGIFLVALAPDDDEIGGDGEHESSDDVVFCAHVFAGVIFKLNSSFELFGGMRYIYMDDPDLDSFSSLSKHSTLDDALHFELGGRFRF
jgi:opacity protein-like surface antigen